MAPPQKPFPVSELEQRIQTHTVDFKEKSRKLPKDFNLKDCELFELVQYSCTTMQQQLENSISNPKGTAQIECFPFARLFRRYGVVSWNLAAHANVVKMPKWRQDFPR